MTTPMPPGPPPGPPGPPTGPMPGSSPGSSSPVPGPRKTGIPAWLIILIVVVVVIGLGCCGIFTLCSIVARRGSEVMTKIGAQAAGIDVNSKANGGGITFRGKGGEVNFGGTKLPANFATDIPIYKGMTPISSAVDTAKSAGEARLSGSATAGDVEAFYEKQMPASGWKQSGNNNSTGLTQLTYTKDDRQAVITIIGNTDDKTTTVQIDYGKKD